MKVHIFKYCLVQNRNFLKIFIGYKRLCNTEGLICHTRYDMEFKNRMQKFRFGLKKDRTKLKKHLEKERERDKKRRDNKKKVMDNDSLEEKRNRDRERQKKCREKKRSIDLGKISSNTHIGSYKSKRSLKKAVTNVKKLTAEPIKRKPFYSKSEILPSELSKALHNTETKSNAISEEVISNIKQFFIRDDISRQSPGIKDYKSIKDPITGKRIQIQKRI
ncbi:uncharacterized protein LOC142238344 [Haematobia irritans]|uniref:uncharacterized protein LOC142238344 n=1 Tax=Haematobia irritans TaxID=7368 RepID=UPI003F507CF0